MWHNLGIMWSVQVTDPVTDQQHAIQVANKPDTCPRCHHGIDAKQTSAAGVNGNPQMVDAVVEVVYRCPKRSCARHFIAVYTKAFPADHFEVAGVMPKNPKEPAIPPEIVEVSPAFRIVYTQATAAEDYQLDQIAGGGFRKALEFLVKDYCIQASPADADGIRAEFLGNTIANRVTDPNIKQCAKRAAWLGNDETHYERRWVDKDLADLKTLINLTMNWIVSAVLTKRYFQDMPDAKKS